MPKVAQQLPKPLRPYTFHGVNLAYSEGDEESTGDCPFCSREGKFSVNVKSGQWQCFVCRTGTDKGGGNASTFLRLLWAESDKGTTPKEYEAILRNRRLLHVDTLMRWGVCKSATTRDWLVPAYGVDGKLNQLYRYIRNAQTGKATLYPTPELGHYYHRPDNFDPSHGVIYVCEGPWDAMALWEMLRSVKVVDGEMVLTGSEQSSLLGNANVIAVPGCGSIGEPFKRWLSLFGGKDTRLMFDSDHPKEIGGKTVAAAGYSAMQRACSILTTSAEQSPSEINYLKWGKDGYDPDRPSGFDVRDYLAQSPTDRERMARLEELLVKIETIPAGWAKGRTREAKKGGGTEMELLECRSWGALTQECRKAMKWTDGLDRALAVMLATITSTKAVGDQLWVKIIGPPSCGKSVLCEAVSTSRQFVIAKSTLSGFHSGYKSDKEGMEDNSLVPKVRDKTLVTKDGDTLLQSGTNLGKILAQARDLFDGSSRTHYGNQMGKDYSGVRMTWILAGTESLRQLDSSELGERFLDCVIMSSIDSDLEDEINRRAVNRVISNRAVESDGSLETHQDEDMTTMMRMTGGYVQYLRSNASRLLGMVEVDEHAKTKCIHFGKFVAYMRARPSLKQDESEGREMSIRLVIQHTRLALCLAVVLNKTTVDEEVLRRVRCTAMDTARGKTLKIVEHLYKVGEAGAEVGQVIQETHETEEKQRRLLRFLRNIGAVDVFKPALARGLKGRPRWKLTAKMRKLYEEVMQPGRVLV